MKDDVFEEYRDRLLEENNILKLEIYETLAGTDFIDNTLELVKMLQNSSKEEIIEDLKEIKLNIQTLRYDKYSIEQIEAYSLIIEGYIIRAKIEL